MIPFYGLGQGEPVIGTAIILMYLIAIELQRERYAISENKATYYPVIAALILSFAVILVATIGGMK